MPVHNLRCEHCFSIKFIESHDLLIFFFCSRFLSPHLPLTETKIESLKLCFSFLFSLLLRVLNKRIETILMNAFLSLNRFRFEWYFCAPKSQFLLLLFALLVRVDFETECVRARVSDCCDLSRTNKKLGDIATDIDIVLTKNAINFSALL